MVLKILKNIFAVLSSKALLLWLIGGWLMYYIASAIWMEEAFAFFVTSVEGNPVIQVLFILFLISGYLNMIRVFKEKLISSKLGFISWLMLSAGVMLYFTGFFLSLNIRQFDNRLAGEGDLLNFRWSNESYRVSSVSPGLKESYLKSDIGGVLANEPRVTIMDSSSNVYEVGAYPPVRIKGSYVHVLNIGFAPGLTIYDKGRIATQGYMALRLLPPGRSDFFELKPYPYRFLVSMSPEVADYSRHVDEPVFNLKDPSFSTRVFRGEQVIAEGPSEKSLNFDGLDLQYSRHKYWVQLESAKDPGIPIMKYGIFLAVLGVPVYLLRLVISLISLR